MARGKLAIGFAHPRDWDAFFGISLVHTLNEDWRKEKRIRGRVIAVRSGPTIDKARNDIVKAFLEHPENPDWLLMVDADMVWSPADLRKLFAAADANERPILGGLCFSGNGLDIWPVMIVFDENGQPKQVMGYPADMVCKVDATGGAFLLIHRGVLERMKEEMGHGHPAPWFAFSYKDGKPYGEDVTFCIRAAKLGYPIYVHTGVSIGHMKSRVLNEDEYYRHLKRVKEEGEAEAADSARRDLKLA